MAVNKQKALIWLAAERANSCASKRKLSAGYSARRRARVFGALFKYTHFLIALHENSHKMNLAKCKQGGNRGRDAGAKTGTPLELSADQKKLLYCGCVCVYVCVCVLL